MDTERPELIALRRAVEIVGSQSAMGRLLGVSQAAVWRWVQNGRSLPPEHVLAVEAATGISKHQLRPDIYPPEQLAASTDLEPTR